MYSFARSAGSSHAPVRTVTTPTTLKARHAELPDVLARIDADLQRITADAYSNVDLVSNEVLSRNPSSTALLHSVAWQTPLSRPGWAVRLLRLARYYRRSVVQFFLYTLTWAVQRAAGGGRTAPVDSTVYVIDTYVFQDVVARDLRYQERFFPGLTAILEARGRKAVILPRFYGTLTNPFRVARVVRLLRRSGETFLTEFELLRASDLLQTLAFILRYPIAVLALARRVSRTPGDVNTRTSAELEATLPQATFPSHLRYLVGRRLGERTRGRLHVISWFENQALEKNFYRGIRQTAAASRIFGCQPFIFAPPYINAFVAEGEVDLHVAPDVVLVGGPAYLRGSRSVAHRVGPSFRYAWLWSTPIDWSRKEGTVVFLAYSQRLSREILGMAGRAATLRGEPIAVQPHPTWAAGRLPDLPSGWRYTGRHTPEVLRAAAMMITSESGTAVEAAASGCSVVLIASQSTVTFNPMPEDGRGEIWELVFDAGELDTAVRQLRDYRARHPERIHALAAAYRDSFFVEPTEQRIIDTFDL